MADDVLKAYKDILKWDPPSWYSMGACYRVPHAVKFLYSRKTKERNAAVELFCRDCIIQYACLDYAIRNEEAGGIWGGYHENERLEISDHWIVKTRESLPLAIKSWRGNQKQKCNGRGEGTKA